MSTDIQQRYNSIARVLKSRRQEHVLRWWHELDDGQRDHLITELEALPWDFLDEVVPTHVLGSPGLNTPTDLAPPKVCRRQPAAGQEDFYREASRKGEELVSAGKVAAFTVAGGQGTRLGADGPKGEVRVTPVGERTLFELFGGMIRAARQRYCTRVAWYVMTSRANHDRTTEYFRRQRFFGLPREDVVIFPQGMLPTFDFQGRLLLKSKHELALAPDGHGGAFKALLKTGALADMRSRGVELISYFQVDNPLVKPVDPLFIGLHAMTGSEMSTKVASKASDFERVGVLCNADGKLVLVEYSELPRVLATARNIDGTRRFDAGNLAMHVIDVAFVERLLGGSVAMPVRRAVKAVAFVSEQGQIVRPSQPNAVKLETFVFDALPFARNPLVLEVDRAEEFSPVKNATGVDSLDSAKRDQNLRACRWLEAAGVTIPRGPDGEPGVTVAIAPTFAQDVEDVIAKADQLPTLAMGDAVYIELDHSL